MIRRLVQCAVLFMCTAACAIDDADLPTAAKAFYSKGTKNAAAYGLLAKSTQQQWSESDFAGHRSGLANDVEDVAVLRQETLGRNAYAMVVVTTLNPTRNCRLHETHTWIREDGKWRALSLLPLRAIAGATPASRDFASARQTAEEWLKSGPVDGEPRSEGGDPRAHPGRPAPRRPQTKEDVVQSLLAANGNDDSSLADWVLSADTIGKAKTRFEKLPRDSCRRDEVAWALLDGMEFTDQLAFLDRIAEPGPLLLTTRRAIGKVWQPNPEAMALLKEHGKAMGDAFVNSEMDSKAALEWALSFGVFAVRNGDEAAAMGWLQTANTLAAANRIGILPAGAGLNRDDPQTAIWLSNIANRNRLRPSLELLRKRLTDPCCNKLAARFGVPRIIVRPDGRTALRVTLENLSPVELGDTSAMVFTEPRESLLDLSRSEVEIRPLAPGESREIELRMPSPFGSRRIDSVSIGLTDIVIKDSGRAFEPAAFWVKVAPSEAVKVPQDSKGP